MITEINANEADAFYRDHFESFGVSIFPIYIAEQASIG